MANAKNQEQNLAQAWEIFNAKRQNVETNVRIHSEYAAKVKKEAEELRSQAEEIIKSADSKADEAVKNLETAQLNQRILTELDLQAEETVKAGNAVAEALQRIKQLPSELQVIANAIAGLDNEPPTDDPEQQPDPEPQATSESEPEPEQQPKPTPQPELPTVAKIQTTSATTGDTASEQIANVPEEKKPEPTTQQQSEPLQNCLDVDGYSFKIDTVNKTFEFYPADSEKRFEGIFSDVEPTPIGLKTSDLKLYISTTHLNEWPSKWDGHLFYIEKALQTVLENPELTVQMPPRARQSAELAKALAVPYRADGLVSLPCDTPEFKAVQKINGYTVSFFEGKDFKLSGKPHTGVTLKVLGEGTTANGIEVNCSFKQNEAEFVVAVKTADGQINDKTSTKRAEMPKWLKPLRRAAIMWMSNNFPYTASKWEDEVTYTTPVPQPTDKQPANAAAAPVK